MKKLKFINIFLGLAIFFSFFLSSSSVFARSPAFTFLNLENGSGSRVFFDDVSPGEKRVGVLKVSVLEDVPIILNLGFFDFLEVKFKRANVSEETKKYVSYSNWINLKVDSPIFIEGLSSLEIPYEIEVPEGALPGDYVGVFIASVDAYGDAAIEKKNSLVNDRSLNFTGAKIYVGLALDFFLRVKGEILPSLDFLDLDYFKESVSNSLSLVMKYKNEGNVGVTPKGHVSIKNFWGREVFSRDFSFLVLGPGQEGSSSVRISPRDFYLSYGIYEVDVDLFYDVFSRQLGENLVYVAGKANMRIYYFPSFLFWILSGIVVALLIIILTRSFRRYLLLKNSKIYVVKKGDTLQLVSEKYHLNSRSVIFLNKLKAPYFLNVGDKILIPLKKLTNAKNTAKK